MEVLSFISEGLRAPKGPETEDNQQLEADMARLLAVQKEILVEIQHLKAQMASLRK